MVQGDLSVVNINHMITAAKTGSIAGTAIVLTMIFTGAKNRWTVAWITGVLVTISDMVVHPKHFGD